MSAPSLGARLLRGLVQGYRLLFSAWVGSGCRFTPSCSAYALEAIDRHGALGGGWLTAGRLLRCHPGCAGGHDAVPPQPPRLFTRFTRSTGPGLHDAAPGTPESSS
ncbi:MAG TPA: membrane protein insertion efficiency factor YidD [Methylibium sp.]|nr:membrane protein insertion efficiency factor YidD [Methylibium sp.]